MSNYFVGLMSGTSIDGIDCALVCFDNTSYKLIATHSESLPVNLANELRSLCVTGRDEINRCGQLDRQVGFLFAQSCLNLLAKANVAPHEVCAIGSHGQTIRHQPLLEHPFTLQIGDPNIIAEVTGITTVADFRRRDMAVGGQGAPLTPAFHRFAFHSSEQQRVVANIGGIANITLIPMDLDSPVLGFDCGPGNVLLDNWARLHLNVHCDHNGEWSRTGEVCSELLEALLTDPYVHRPLPKSTGPEYFNLLWLQEKMRPLKVTPQSVQATLAEYTARSILLGISQITNTASQILLCGGGAYNLDLVARIKKNAGSHAVYSTADFGIEPDWVEAIAFAWLAKQTLQGLAGNLPEVTGARKPCILGGIYPVLRGKG